MKKIIQNQDSISFSKDAERLADAIDQLIDETCQFFVGQMSSLKALRTEFRELSQKQPVLLICEDSKDQLHPKA